MHILYIANFIYYQIISFILNHNHQKKYPKKGSKTIIHQQIIHHKSWEVSLRKTGDGGLGWIGEWGRTPGPNKELTCRTEGLVLIVDDVLQMWINLQQWATTTTPPFPETKHQLKREKLVRTHFRHRFHIGSSGLTVGPLETASSMRGREELR